MPEPPATDHTPAPPAATAAPRQREYRTVRTPPRHRQVRGRLVDEPAPVGFFAPAALCEPIDGQRHGQVPTGRPGITPAGKAEEPVHFTGDAGPARIVHRGHCHAVRDVSGRASTQQALRRTRARRRRPVRGAPARPAAAHRRAGSAQGLRSADISWRTVRRPEENQACGNSSADIAAAPGIPGSPQRVHRADAQEQRPAGPCRGAPRPGGAPLRPLLPFPGSARPGVRAGAQQPGHQSGREVPRAAAARGAEGNRPAPDGHRRPRRPCRPHNRPL